MTISFSYQLILMCVFVCMRVCIHLLFLVYIIYVYLIKTKLSNRRVSLVL